ncbi:P-loop containing nucleoside triphosphate hydrolase protein [Neocallimastix lanati (nom. inval.)]|uniref:p-loop containing nucleoside triphosphate hydrolase protein n=1 Tax=Neocallimastix californiae TaxID=1754190 RepID=A0A1Y2EL60_9FUNG|nr:P-loop containing nucleoside triphosphate hydrolase protein [Neocallimastix sp. JGI-2020a]ORY72310.1 P-loop containing nucleoside triphosphate hydrolase protein [Neocallimastix californiae]|eukprot:ORY72310.1 P-loop containing nucleoside triphosphate hydrolase protein [Neocallimastix californiae]
MGNEKFQEIISTREIIKIIVIGSCKAGKTSLISRYIEDSFSPEYKQTLGAEISNKYVGEGQNKRTLEICCCSGHERYKCLLDQFYKEIDGAIICYDMSNKSSFEDTAFWYNEIKRVSPDAYTILVGTKNDDSDNIKVKGNDAIKQAESWGIPYMDVSSKTGINVNELFSSMVKNIKKD